MFSFFGPQRTCAHPDALIVLLHGYGLSGDYFMPLVDAFNLPNAYFWCPDGLEPCPEYPPGRQWFSFEGSFWNVDPQAQQDHTLGLLKASWHTFYQRLDRAASEIAHRIQEGLKGFTGPVFIGGFSQGCGMAFHIGLEKMTLAGVVGFSGFYLLEQEPAYKPPFFWCHGDRDEMIDISWMTQAQQGLLAYNIPVESHVIRNLTHQVSVDGVQKAREFIIRAIEAWPGEQACDKV